MGLLVPNLFAVGIASVGAIIDTAFASYLPDTSSIPAITNALMLFGLPSVLLAQAVSQSLLLFLKLLTGQYAILAIPLAASVVGTTEAAFLSFILFVRLRKKILTDKGLQRLKQRRLHTAGTILATKDADEFF